MAYSALSRTELSKLKRFFDSWGVFDLLAEKCFLINQSTKVVYLVPCNEFEIILKDNPYSAGMPIGHLRKHFLPMLPLVDIVARNGNKREYPFVKINPAAEKLFLYGRDLFGNSIMEHSVDLKQNQLVIVLNSHFEPVGLGLTNYDYQEIGISDRVTVQNITDNGSYLREE